MIDELHQALLAARFDGGPQALSARECLRMATMGGARCLGRDAELGSLEPGKAADLAVWRTDHLPGAGIADPVITLVFGAPVLEHLFVGGRPVVTAGELRTADQAGLAAAAAEASAVIAGAP
jgi:cytosine/adenosine deaminase-related metal-dependent hydrolase